MSDDLLPIPMWRVSAKILCTCCGAGLFRQSHFSSNEGDYDEVCETDLGEMMKQQMDWAEAEGWEVNHDAQTAFCDMCVRMPEEARDRRTVHTRKRRVGYLGQGTSTGYYEDWGYGGYNTWDGGGCTISHSKSSSYYQAPPSDQKVKAKLKDAAAEALARIEDHRRQQAIADGGENPPERHAEYDTVRDIVIDASRAMDKLRSLKGEENTKVAIETNALIKQSKKEIAKLIEALESREADTEKVSGAMDELSKMQVEILDKHLAVPKAKKKKEPKKKAPAEEQKIGKGVRVRLTDSCPMFGGRFNGRFGTVSGMTKDLSGADVFWVVLEGDGYKIPCSLSDIDPAEVEQLAITEGD